MTIPKFWPKPILRLLFLYQIFQNRKPQKIGKSFETEMSISVVKFSASGCGLGWGREPSIATQIKTAATQTYVSTLNPKVLHSEPGENYDVALDPFYSSWTKTSFVIGSESRVRRCQTTIGDDKTVPSSNHDRGSGRSKTNPQQLIAVDKIWDFGLWRILQFKCNVVSPQCNPIFLKTEPWIFKRKVLRMTSRCIGMHDKRCKQIIWKETRYWSWRCDLWTYS